MRDVELAWGVHGRAAHCIKGYRPAPERIKLDHPRQIEEFIDADMALARFQCAFGEPE
jgi:hypothetical protein